MEGQQRVNTSIHIRHHVLFQKGEWHILRPLAMYCSVEIIEYHVHPDLRYRTRLKESRLYMVFPVNPYGTGNMVSSHPPRQPSFGCIRSFGLWRRKSTHTRPAGQTYINVERRLQTPPRRARRANNGVPRVRPRLHPSSAA